LKCVWKNIKNLAGCGSLPRDHNRREQSGERTTTGSRQTFADAQSLPETPDCAVDKSQHILFSR
jgi:hypothetical protein